MDGIPIYPPTLCTPTPTTYWGMDGYGSSRTKTPSLSEHQQQCSLHRISGGGGEREREYIFRKIYLKVFKFEMDWLHIAGASTMEYSAPAITHTPYAPQYTRLPSTGASLS